MDYLRQHGALVLDHRFRRLTEYLLKAAEETYQALELPFRARWASTYLLLEESGPLGITEIAAELKLTHPGIIGITDEMRGDGIVTFVKDRKDARRRTVTLTPKGRSLAARLHEVWAALESAQRQRFARAGCDIVPVVNSVEDGLSARPLTAEVVARVARGRRGKAPVAAVAGMLLLLASASRPVLSQSPSQPPPSVRSSLVQAIADSLINGYIYEDRARAMTDSLRAALFRGAFDGAPDRGTLARTIGEFLQRISLDRHLSVSFDAAAPTPAAAPGPQRVRRPSAAGNDGFGRSEILPGHIGYLELFGFSGDPTALHKADSVMSAFAGVTALIIDLRQNTGGGPEMVRRLSTWLFDKPTHLVSTFARGMDQPSERWTQDPVPGNRLTTVPVYILTSRRTFSAAESFTFGLKAAGRVTIVGERTGGGGHFGRFIPLIGGFSMFLPVGRTYDPRTGQGWEAEGIAPDVAVPQEQALEKALGLARGTDSALRASRTPLPSVSLPPELDRVLRECERHWQAHDPEALAALFVPDGFVLRPGRAPVRGRAGIAEAYRGAGGLLVLRALAYATADTVGYIIGAYAADAGGDVGKFILALRRDRGGPWRIAADMDNGDRLP